jgi:hypothetical protein
MISNPPKPSACSADPVGVVGARLEPFWLFKDPGICWLWLASPVVRLWRCLRARVHARWGADGSDLRSSSGVRAPPADSAKSNGIKVCAGTGAARQGKLSSLLRSVNELNRGQQSFFVVEGRQKLPGRYRNTWTPMSWGRRKLSGRCRNTWTPISWSAILPCH